MAAIFTLIQEEFKEYGYLSELFTFVDATHLIAKANLWKERDAAISAEYEQFNNEILPKVAADQQARIGCKGKGKFWYGYKQQVSVDMQSGIIPSYVPTMNGSLLSAISVFVITALPRTNLPLFFQAISFNLKRFLVLQKLQLSSLSLSFILNFS